MKFYVPDIGEQIKLDKDWIFTLYQESRNSALIDIISPGTPYYKWQATDVTLNKGSILKVDRIYIRKGKQEYSSITFVLTQTTQFKTKKKPRFWAKLEDVNKIEFSYAFLATNRLLK